MDPTTAFVMALLALVVASAGLVVSVLTYLHTRRRDFPESKLRLVHRRDDGTIYVHVESVGAGVATRIESWVWDHAQKVWYNQGPWAVPMAPGDQLSAGQFKLGGRFSRVRVSWCDDARPDKRRTVTLRWKS